MRYSEGQRGQGVEDSKGKNMVNVSSQYEYEVMMEQGELTDFVQAEEHVHGRQQPAKGTTRTANGQDTGEQ